MSTLELAFVFRLRNKPKTARKVLTCGKAGEPSEEAVGVILQPLLFSGEEIKRIL